MALIEMDFATGIGEHYEETLLWTNSSPTSNFAAQTITLSQSMSDFDMLRFEIRTHVSSPTTTKSIYVPLSYFNSTSSGANAYKLVLGVYQFTNLYARETYKSSDTQIYISEARRLNASGTSTDQTIPYKIYGVKKVGGSSDNEGTLIWTNPNSTLTLASGQITLTDNLSNYTKIRIKWYVGGASAVARDETKEIESIIPIVAFASPGTVNGAPGLGGVIGNAGVRYFFRNNGDADNTLRTQVSIGSAFVPYKIYGIK